MTPPHLTPTAINIVGLRESARTQNLLTILEVGGLLLVAIAGLIATAPVEPSAATPTAWRASPTATSRRRPS